MEAKKIRNKIKKEIDQIPDEHVLELFDVVNQYRQNKRNENGTNSILSFAGCLSDMSSKEFDAMMSEIQQNRKKAFSQRGKRESSID